MMKNICWYLDQTKKTKKIKKSSEPITSGKTASVVDVASIVALGLPVIRNLPVTQYPKKIVEKHFAKLPSESEFEAVLKNRYYRQAAESLDEAQVEMIVNKLIEKLTREGAI